MESTRPLTEKELRLMFHCEDIAHAKTPEEREMLRAKRDEAPHPTSEERIATLEAQIASLQKTVASLQRHLRTLSEMHP